MEERSFFPVWSVLYIYNLEPPTHVWLAIVVWQYILISANTYRSSLVVCTLFECKLLNYFPSRFRDIDNKLIVLLSTHFNKAL